MEPRASVILLLLVSAAAGLPSFDSVQDDSSFFNVSTRGEFVAMTNCSYPSVPTYLAEMYQYTRIFKDELTSNRSCYTHVQSLENSYQRYTCVIQLNYLSQFAIYTPDKLHVAYMCKHKVCEPSEFTFYIPTNSIYTFFRSGPNNSGSVQCVAQAITVEPVPLQEAKYCECGQPKAARIVGGQDADIGEYPFMAQLLYRGNTRSFCGGSLISNMFVMTAAHCTRGLEASDITVGLGVTRAGDYSTGRRIAVSRIVEHPDYTNFIEGSDIALLKLKEVIDFRDSSSNFIRPVCLPNNNSTYAGITGVAIGWGRLAEGGSTPIHLQEVNVPVYSNSECSSIYGSVIKPGMICAGGRDAEGICQGDSGGPLIHRTPAGFYEAIGISSFGRGCARFNNPGVFARVTAFMGWVNRSARGSITCSRPQTIAA